MAVELYNDGRHVCLAFCDLVDEDASHAVQCNQFLVVDGAHGALIDPGGNMTYSALMMAMQRYFPARDLDLILASHADPDIIASLNKWMVGTSCTVMISKLWTRFLPHFTSGRDYTARTIGIPDEGMRIALGDSELVALPAHFMHSEGNFQFYDPVSKILFSGDMGASMTSADGALPAVADFDAHIHHMFGFHRRYMVSNKICRYWANMVRTLDVDMIVPQHGARFEGPAMVQRFITWIENLPCGVDLMTQAQYRVP
ncbi:MAG: MBL fold metallo-hydrolase [Gammaproteobacteria bacterium]|jgi:flavorubredoxin|nr:MBL fold metallo-hydrolase [Gammaproteobacteria bacterium]MBU0770507.1 MBL fold metallo-hydrolase [Gammaproteobacteria bacterium]MBU1846011.1 MBL fold metallo-hydrolase [Gammaproteobacteria bacterium]